MAAYTTWTKVVQLYPRAGDVESVSGNQTALIAAKQNLFHSFIRHIHKNDLTTIDECVSEAVALLIVDELRRRAQTDDDERSVEVNYPHYKGITTPEGAGAHALIHAIRDGAIVLTQDKSDKDVLYPAVTPATGNTSVGTVECYLPHEYKSDRIDTFTIKCTTGGRVDVATAIFSVYQNFGATPIGMGLAASEAWTHISNELYVRFVDTALTGAMFVVNDTWTIVAVPPTNPSRSTGPTEYGSYLG
jgi:hypothetical protein